MLNLSKRTKKKSRAQAMLEFALALPVLLLVVYGLLETGRLLFIYASTVTAARQAVRYGSATGISGNGVPYYADCAGIIAAVDNVGFINDFDNILISYDTGPSGTVFSSTCPPSPAPENGDRINVQVSADWIPIVPIVPFDPFTITANSSRTILVSVSIAVTAPPSSFSGTGGGSLSLTVTADPGPYDSDEDTIVYTYVITNNGTGDLLGPFTLTDHTDDIRELAIDTSSCASAPPVLAEGATYTCYGYYDIQLEDMNTGFVQNLATAETDSGFSDQDGVNVVLTQLIDLHLDKSGPPFASTDSGTPVEYTYVLTNNSTVSLDGPIEMDDDHISNVSCDQTTPFDPGQTRECTGTYELKQVDINRGSVTNYATGSAYFGGTQRFSNEDYATVFTPPIYLTAGSLTASAQGPVEFIFNLLNNTGSTLSSPFALNITQASVSTSRFTVACDQPNSVAAGGSVPCTATIDVQQTDIDAGTPITITATATGKSGNRTVTSNAAPASLTFSRSVVLSFVLAADTTTATTAGDPVNYTYTITNEGNVTLYPASITDTLGNTITCAGGTGGIAPLGQGGNVRQCSATYNINSRPGIDDLAAGLLTNMATFNYTVGSTTGQAGTQQSNTVPITTFVGARLTASITTSSPGTVDQNMTFNFILQNTGNADLSFAQPYYIKTEVLDSSNNVIRTENVYCPLVRSEVAVGESPTQCDWLDYIPGAEGSFTIRIYDVVAGNADDPANPPAPGQATAPFTVNPTP